MLTIRKTLRSFSKIKPLKIDAYSVKDGVKVHSSTTDHNWEVHNALESLLGALAGCEYATLKGVTAHGPVKVISIKFNKV